MPIYVIPNRVDAQLSNLWIGILQGQRWGLDSDYNIVLLQGSIDIWVDVRVLLVGFSHGKQYFKQTLEYTKRHGLEKYIYTPNLTEICRYSSIPAT